MPFGPVELGILLLLVIMLFGGGKLASLGSSLGKSIRDFRRETGRLDDDTERGISTAVRRPMDRELPAGR